MTRFNAAFRANLRAAALLASALLLTVTAPHASAVSATGGTITRYSQGGTNWTAHIFTTNGTFAVSDGGNVELLIVAGGGGGGRSSLSGAGGGGAGGLIFSNNFAVGITNYIVTVGGGGAGRSVSGGSGGTGTNSAFGAISAAGGGGGGSSSAGGSGGSGGGSGGGGSSGTATPAGQGNNGGGSVADGGGGGGGAAAVGGTGTPGIGGNGGAGLNYSLSGVTVGYAGGGGGGATTSGTATHGGGNGGKTGSLAGNGTAGTGGGGGGTINNQDGGNGGSGIVIVRYLLTGDAVFTPALQPTYTTNAILRTNLFTAIATNTLGHAVEFQFDWGSELSGWSNSVASGAFYTNQYVWTDETNATVRVRARCATHPDTVSDWSAPVAVTITNAYRVAASPALLDFGGLWTNQTTTRTLAISNSGPAAVTITSISYPTGFSGACAGVLNPGVTTNVTITFQPQALGAYGGTVTVNGSQVLTGTRTIQVTGVCEVASTPVCTNLYLAGLANDLTAFGFAATTTVGHAIEYFYNWGDGTNTTWTNNAAMAHVWGAASNYALVVRARCQAHTNIISAWSATNWIRIYDAPTFAFSPRTNGLPFLATMTAPGTVSNCVFAFRPPLSAYFQPTNMSHVSGNDWQVGIPPLNAGTMQYYVQYMRDNFWLRYPNLTNLNLIITNSPAPARRMSFESGWTGNTTPPYDQSDDSTGWGGTQIRVTNTADAVLGRTPDLLNNSGKIVSFVNTNEAMVVSPVFSAGIGSIYFEAGLRVNDGTGKDNTIIVQVSTDGGANWTDLQSYTLHSVAAGNPPIDIHPVIQVNLRLPARVRIYQPDACGDSQNVLLDNIVISSPPTDVRITELLKNPGYPSCKDPVRLRCRTEDYANLVTGNVDAPSANRRLSLWYRHDSMGSFVSTSMVATGTATYEGVLPVYPAGAMQYFFRCDFDGYFFTNSLITNTAYATASYPSEQVSPSFLPDARTGDVVGIFRALATYPVPATTNALSYQIRSFRSDYDYLWIQTTPTNAAQRMELVEDYVWQGTTRVTGITNLTWHYYGYAPYSNNATAFGTLQTWGDTNQYYLHYPPMGGYAEADAAQPMQAELVYDGYLINRFVSTNGSYVVRKGVYQTFDTWSARPDYFEESLGLSGVQLYTNNFSGWELDYYTANPGTNMNFSEASTDGYARPGVIGASRAWGCLNASAVAEFGLNKALCLSNYPAGYIWNTENYGLTEGLASLSGRMRLSLNDGRYAVSGLDYSWTNAYRITNTLYVSSASSAEPYVSTLFCFRPEAGGTEFQPAGHKYYELRLTQSGDYLLELDLYRWNHSQTATLIKHFNGVLGLLTGAIPIQVDIAWTNVGSTNVWFSGRVYRDSTTYFQLDQTPCKDTSINLCITNGGGVGFLGKDAALEVRALTVARGTNLANKIVTGFTNFWYLGGNSWTSVADCWSITGSGADQKLSRLVAPSQLAVYALRNGTSRTYNQDERRYDWLLIGTYPVTSFAYTNFLCQPKYWDKVYIETRFSSGELPIVVDDYALTPWRAKTHGVVSGAENNQDAAINGVKFWDWTEPAQQFAWSQTDSGWQIFEGIVEGSASDPCVTLDVTRANPALIQGVSSLYLTNGFGSIGFRAQVLAGTSIYRIERTDSDFPEQWKSGENFTNTVTDGAVDRFVPVRAAGTAGRIRIVQVPVSGGSSADAILKLDNLTVRDYPPPDVLAWNAYNCLIAPPLTNNQTIGRSYEGTNFLDRRTCYLNNSPTNGVRAPASYTEINPYIQTPAVDTGVGQVAFWYRAWDSNAVQVLIQGAPSAAGPWTTLTNFTVTSTNYAYFDTGTTLYKPNHTVLRISVTNALSTPATTGRLCIDNVLMAESVRPSYTITDVQLLPAQPLFTNQVGVQVTIDRFLMDPSGTRLYLSYVTGTNNWGYTNWWGTGSTPTAGVVTVELTNSTAHHYVSAGTAFIPPMAIDQVVQYVVWGTVAGWTNYPIFQGTNAFTNPSWYYPVDLNSTYASQGWSPYYYSYSCPTGSVWINEINHFNYLTADQTNEYVEIIGPATTRLGDWKIVLLDNTRTEKNRCVISNSVVLENGYNGWGFFVCGDSGVANINHVLAPNPTYCMPNAGIIRLERSMGAWEDLVSYQQVLSVPGVPMSTAYAGAKPGFPSGNGCSSLGLTNTAYSLVNYGSNKADFAWSKFSAGSYTPGQRNANQMLRAVTNTVQYWFLTSVVGLHGTHSLSAVRVSVPSGSTQLVTYAADPWYRIQSFVTDGVTNQAAESAALFVWAVTNINRDYSNNVSFRLTLDGTENTNGVPSWWLASFGQTEQKSLDDADGVGVWQEYLLNQNPYVSNGPVRFTLEALAVTGTTVSATVRLLESTNGVYYPQPTIYGALYLQGTTNLNPGSWSDIATQTPGSVFDTNGRKLFTFPAQTNRFYKAQIR